jgi:hypothetical protein
VTLELQRALGAVGGALGALPLLPIARGLAQRLAGPPRLPGAELVAGDIKAGTWAELAVLVLVVPASAFFFGRLLPELVNRRGGLAAALPGLVMSSSLVLWRLGARPVVSIAAAGLASLLLTAVFFAATRFLGRGEVGTGTRPLEPSVGFDAEPEVAPVPRWAIALVLALLIAASYRTWGPARGPIDLFEEGQVLAAMQIYLNGGAPYLDTYPVHGWGTDGGVDSVAAKLFGDRVEVVRTRRAIWGALGVAGLALAAWALFRRPVWSVLAFALALCLCPYPSERQAPAFAGLAALVWAARSGRRRGWLLAGAVASAVVFYALEYGLFLLTAGVLTIVTSAVLERRFRKAGYAWLAFVGGATLGAAPFFATLAARGALLPFLQISFLELPATIEDVWGLPAASTIPLLRDGTALALARALLRAEGVPWLFHAAVLALVAALLLFRSVRPGWSRTDHAALAAAWFAILAMRGALGRADWGHLVMHGVFVALPASWLLFRAAHARHARWLLTAALAACLVVVARPTWLVAVIRDQLHRVPQCERALADRGRMPCFQADDLAALRGWMDRELQFGQTFFDYGNEPALHYFLDRRMPVRFPCAPSYQTEQAQRDVIAALEREKPPIAILASGSWSDAFDNVSTRTRTPIVAAYLDRYYEPAGNIGLRTLGRRRLTP